MFDGKRVTGWEIRLPGWSEPVVADIAGKKLHFDNFNGHWGDRAKLDQFMQAYATEAAKAQARKLGYRVSEQLQANGAIKLVLAK